MATEDISDLPVPKKDDLSDLPVPRQKSRFPDIKPYETPSIPERLGATAYGAVTGLLGAPGELEKFGAYTVPEMLGFREQDEPRGKFMGRETIFPTIQEAEKGLAKLGIEKPREEVAGPRMLGEILSPTLMTGPRLARSIVGTPTATSERSAQAAEQLGFRLSPAQVRGDDPIPMKGATGYAEENQTLANRLASRGTGQEVAEIDRDFLRGRFNSLSRDFDNLYQGRIFNIDPQAVNAIRAIANIQNQLPNVASTAAVQQTANNIINNFQRLANRPGAQPNTFAVEGEALQTLRNALSEFARSTSNRGDAYQTYNLIDLIDDSIQRNHPQIAAQLQQIRPQYRNTVILEDLMRRQGIQQGNISLEQLGQMLGSQRDAVRRGNMDIDELGRLGSDLKLRARWERQGGTALPTTGTNVVLGRMTGLAGDLGTTALLGIPRGRMARTAQRQLARLPSVGQSYARPASLLGGGVAGQFREQEE
jgi:hypothetical protein